LGGSHYSVDVVSRGDEGGGNAVSSSSYLSGEVRTDTADFDGDGKRKYDVRDDDRPVLANALMAPDHIDVDDLPFGDASELWSAVEDRENRSDSRLARTITAELPAALGAEKCIEVAKEQARRLADRHGVAVEVGVHPPDENDNIHTHYQLTRRRLDPGAENGLGATTSEFDAWTDPDDAPVDLTGPDLIEGMRSEWAGRMNARLFESAEHPQTLDPDDFLDVRSLQDRYGLDNDEAGEIAEEHDLQGFHKIHEYHRPNEPRTVETVNGNEITAEEHNERVDRVVRALGLEAEPNLQIPDAYIQDPVKRVEYLAGRTDELDAEIESVDRAITEAETGLKDARFNLKARRQEYEDLSEFQGHVEVYREAVRELESESVVGSLWDRLRDRLGAGSKREEIRRRYEKVEENRPPNPMFRTDDPDELLDAIEKQRDKVQRVAGELKGKIEDLEGRIPDLKQERERLGQERDKTEEGLRAALERTPGHLTDDNGVAVGLDLDDELYELDRPGQSNDTDVYTGPTPDSGSDDDTDPGPSTPTPKP
jgi:prefoldin subunit 5